MLVKVSLSAFSMAPPILYTAPLVFLWHVFMQPTHSTHGYGEVTVCQALPWIQGYNNETNKAIVFLRLALCSDEVGRDQW